MSAAEGLFCGIARRCANRPAGRSGKPLLILPEGSKNLTPRGRSLLSKLFEDGGIRRKSREFS